MQHEVVDVSPLEKHPTAVPFPMALLSAIFLLCTPSACGPVAEPEEQQELAAMQQTLYELNGLSPNGLAFNGLAFNGLAFNGLAFNGLAFNGLSTAEFSSWFESDPAMGNMVMRYIVQCAAPAGQTRSYTAPTGSTYSWQGNLGLAPDWASGAPATLEEQQLISACLAAHTNKFGVRVPISVLGRNALNEAIPYTKEELEDFPEREACFFGNLFNGEGLYTGNDGRMLHHENSSARACARSDEKEDTRQPCLPIVRVRIKCDKVCEKDEAKEFYASCTYNGVTYRPITTRMRKNELFKCGDGVCQYTESCGTGHTPGDCGKDCGPCPTP
ncbi:hypothetical protein KYC5002_21510 [Archangium violaceum]|uniref:hypothetical protein n=1 Tax=Archangium violaceum TaxID=83451 RepID=UPI002B2B02D5|nr:hypothetical protein KYC5002_21510 [Archangium gephyra]